MKSSNAHTHTTFCDGKNTPFEMLQQAEKLGFVALGFTGHACQTANNFFGLKDEEGYIAAIRNLQDQSKKVRVHLGIELDAVSWCNRKEYDYVLGGFHYLLKAGFVYPVDGKRRTVQAAINHLYGGDSLKAAVDFFRTTAELCEKFKPDIMGHYDIIAKNNEDGTLFDIENRRYQGAALESLEAVKACGAILEVNTGAMARGYRTTPYPYLFVLKRWKEMGGNVILGSDCHNRDFLNYGFNEALDLIRCAGFRNIVRLGGFGEPLFVEEVIE